MLLRPVRVLRCRCWRTCCTFSNTASSMMASCVLGKMALLLKGIVPLLLVPDGVGIGLEVHRTARVLPPFQNRHNGTAVPVAGVLRFLVWGLDALQALYALGVSTLSAFSWLAICMGPRPFIHRSKMRFTTSAATGSTTQRRGVLRSLHSHRAHWWSGVRLAHPWLSGRL